jgi:hypothetical protein
LNGPLIVVNNALQQKDIEAKSIETSAYQAGDLIQFNKDHVKQNSVKLKRTLSDANYRPAMKDTERSQVYLDNPRSHQRNKLASKVTLKKPSIDQTPS